MLRTRAADSGIKSTAGRVSKICPPAANCRTLTDGLTESSSALFATKISPHFSSGDLEPRLQSSQNSLSTADRVPNDARSTTHVQRCGPSSVVPETTLVPKSPLIPAFLCDGDSLDGVAG
jgi:hypothetical protein